MIYIYILHITRISLQTYFSFSDVLHVYSSQSCRCTFRPGRPGFHERSQRARNERPRRASSVWQNKEQFLIVFNFDFYQCVISCVMSNPGLLNS